MLEKISFKGFMSFEDTTVELRRTNVLVGANGAGKSNFVQLLKMIHLMMTEDIRAYVGKMGGADRFLFNGKKHTRIIRAGLEFKKNETLSYHYRCSLTPDAEDNLMLNDDEVGFHDKAKYKDREPYWDTITIVKYQSNLLKSTDEIAKYVRKHIDSYRVYHFHDTSFNATVKGSSHVGDNKFYREDASNLAAYLYYLKGQHQESYRNIVETIRLAAPFFDDFALEPDRNNTDLIRLEWKEKGTDAYRNAHYLSDGTLRFICLVVLFLQPKPPATIIIDEPELGLHPSAIKQLAALIQGTKAEQVIVATQSVTLLDEFVPDDVIVADTNRAGVSTLQRPDTEALKAWVDEYSMGEIWLKNLIGGRP